MRAISASLVSISLGLGFWACSSPGESPPAENLEQQGALGGVGGTAIGTATPTANAVGNTTGTPSTGTPTTGGGPPTTSSGTTAVNNVTTGSTNLTNGAGASNGTGGTSDGGSTSDGSGGFTSTCTDDRHPDHLDTPCSEVATWDECDSDWLQGYCDSSCGRRNGNGNGGSSGQGANNTTSADTNGSSTTGQLNDDNPWGNVENGQSGWASRYWDCCKPSCGWSGNAQNPVKSCDVNDSSMGANDETNACELGGQSGSFTCHSMAPWAYSSQVSLGFAAINGVSCGSCFHLQFTGNSHNAPGDPGSAALAGKTMIVMASNIGGIEQGQFDLLIPGGGVGDFDACSGQWGVDSSQLGAQYGGFLPECKSGDLSATKSCMRDKCSSIFESRGLTRLYDGCMWFVDWFEAADNPSFTYREIECPQELQSAAR